MRSLVRRFKIEQDKRPELSSLIAFSRAVRSQRFSRRTLIEWFDHLVEEGDYELQTKAEIIDHLLEASHSSK